MFLSGPVEARFSGLDYEVLFKRRASWEGIVLKYRKDQFLAVGAYCDNGLVAVIKGLPLISTKLEVNVCERVHSMCTTFIRTDDLDLDEVPALRQAGIVILLGVLAQEQQPLFRVVSNDHPKKRLGLERIRSLAARGI